MIRGKAACPFGVTKTKQGSQPLQSAKQALGAAGPTPTTVTDFGGADQLSITPGFTCAYMAGMTQRLVVADLSPVHQARKDQGVYDGGFSGSHSDINFAEIYNMIAGFFFK